MVWSTSDLGLRLAGDDGWGGGMLASYSGAFAMALLSADAAGRWEAGDVAGGEDGH